jgi:hypothetical protein
MLTQSGRLSAARRMSIQYDAERWLIAERGT